MINLFENYGEKEILLETSLHDAGYLNQTVVLNDDGYLPTHVHSPVGFFTGMNKSKKNSSSPPKFFNELTIPVYWEIVSEGNRAIILDGYRRKGIITYSRRSKDYRLIQSVEWFNAEERTRAIDLYNQNGWCFGRKTYSDGEHVLTSYFDEFRHEVILVNHVIGSIQVFYQGNHYFFESVEDFTLFYFEIVGISTTSIYYNSLGIPFFITNILRNRNLDKYYHHTLFWQEESQEMPKNMRYILDNKENSTKRIVVQSYQEYLRLKSQIGIISNIQFEYLGFHYRFEEPPTFQPIALILTNSDQIAQIREILAQLSNYKIMIAAKTEMSSNLTCLEDEYSNVQLYAQVTEGEIEKLFSKASIYLDINYGDEVNNAVFSAFQKNLLIFSFDELVHNRDFVQTKTLFKMNEYTKLCNKMNDFLVDEKIFIQLIEGQHNEAGQTSITDYKKVLKA